MKELKVIVIVVLTISLLSAVPLQAAWNVNGNPIATNGYNNLVPHLIADGTGGAIIVWEHVGSREICAQRVDTYGSQYWGTDGTDVCTASVSYAPRIASDGAGGAIITWYTPRNSSWDIYAQRINASGSGLWVADGIAVCEADDEQKWPVVVTDGAKGGIFLWRDGRNLSQHLYAQRVDSLGTIMWPEGGIPICIETDLQWVYEMIPDGNGGAIIVWQDDRDGSTRQNIVGQRIDENGSPRWGENGMGICYNMEFQSLDPNLVSDGSGGAIITWQCSRAAGPGIYAQRVDSAGTLLWPVDGAPVSRGFLGMAGPNIARDGSGGAVIAWEDSRDDGSDIYAQRIDGSGLRQWDTVGVALCAATGVQYTPEIVFDEAGGAIVVWKDFRNGADYNLYAQRISLGGVAQWNPNGEPVCLAAGIQQGHQIAANGLGGAFITWEDFRTGSGWSTYAARIDQTGYTDAGESHAPGVASLKQNYPNPFNPATTIRFDLPRAAHVRLCVYNVKGEFISTIVDRQMTEGRKEIHWAAKDASGSVVASGIYFYRLEAGDFVQTRKMVLLK